MNDPSGTVAMVFAGGLGLAAYHAGAYQAFAERDGSLHWVAGSSAGAVTSAIIAGNRTERRIERLREFWNFPPEDFQAGPWRHLHGWIGAFQTRLFGSAGHFFPRFPLPNPFRFQSLYDLAPMRERMARLIDFGCLNSGETRVCVAVTDIETGAPVIFDSQTHTIEMDHLLASCGFLPEFAPVEIDGRLLGDGGLSINAPFDPIMQADLQGDLLIYVLDLYARDGTRPVTLEAAAERKNDLLFGNQTLIRLQYAMQLRKLRQQLDGGHGQGTKDKITLLSYRPGTEEAGPEKSFELSPAAHAQRWKAGYLDMQYSHHHLAQSEDIIVVRRPRALQLDRYCSI
jgi:NTE family protein